MEECYDDGFERGLRRRVFHPPSEVGRNSRRSGRASRSLPGNKNDIDALDRTLGKSSSSEHAFDRLHICRLT